MPYVICMMTFVIKKALIGRFTDVILLLYLSLRLNHRRKRHGYHKV